MLWRPSYWDKAVYSAASFCNILVFLAGVVGEISIVILISQITSSSSPDMKKVSQN